MICQLGGVGDGYLGMKKNPYREDRRMCVSGEEEEGWYGTTHEALTRIFVATLTVENIILRFSITYNKLLCFKCPEL